MPIARSAIRERPVATRLEAALAATFPTTVIALEARTRIGRRGCQLLCGLLTRGRALGWLLRLRIGRTDCAYENEDRKQQNKTAHAGSHA